MLEGSKIRKSLAAQQVFKHWSRAKGWVRLASCV